MSDKRKWTPGPWTVEAFHAGTALRAIVAGKALDIVAMTGDPDKPSAEERQEADACLIAAAPQMAEALRALVEAVEQIGMDGDNATEPLLDARAALRAAGVES